MFYSHFMSAAAQTTTVSTTPSAFLMAVIGLKIVFFWEYREYRRLRERRMFLYILMILLVAINLIPIFVVNNVDYSAHLGTHPATQPELSWAPFWAYSSSSAGRNSLLPA